MAKKKDKRTVGLSLKDITTPEQSDAPERLVEDTIRTEQQDIKEVTKQPTTDIPEKMSSSASNLTSNLTKIKIATTTGVRTYAVSQNRLKQYGKISNKLTDGMPTYARKIRMFYADTGITRMQAVVPERKEQLYYNEDIKAWSKFVPNAPTSIIVRDKKTGEERTITTTQEHVKAGIYGVVETRGRGRTKTNVYEKQKNTATRRATREEEKEIRQNGGMYPTNWQLKATWHITVTSPTGFIIWDGEKLGYSFKNHYSTSLDDMINQSYHSALKRLFQEEDIKYDAANDIENELLDHEVYPFVWGS
jgi:hypothetical protein